MVLREARIELAARDIITGVLGPLHEIGDCPLGAVAVVDLERVAIDLDVGLHSCQGLRRLIGEPALGYVIPGDRPSHEVVLSAVADLLHDVRCNVGEPGESCGRLGRLAAACAEGEYGSRRREGSGNDGHRDILHACLAERQHVALR